MELLNLPERLAYLERLWGFAADLAPAHNGLKFNILYHRLVLDRKMGVYDIDRFRQYVSVPHHAPYVNAKWIDEQRRRNPDHQADPSADYREATLLPPVGNDEPLVRDYLAHFFVDEDRREEFRPYLREEYLNKVFAEARLLAGVGKPEALYSLLTPAEVQALRDRVDIEFAPTCPDAFQPGEAVKLAVHVKNVEQLLVRIYRINELNYYREEGKEVDTTIALDGLVPNYEVTHRYSEPPIRRVGRTFEFAEINAPGVWVVELIGSGRSSRAVIRVGRLRYTVENGPGGHVFRVYDQANEPCPEAKLLIEGHQYEPDDRGRILAPYTTRPGRQKVILVEGDRATLDDFQHEAEAYRFDAGFHLEREEILDGQQAKLVIRPTLRLGGAVLPIGLLEKVRLTVSATDLDGVASSQTTADFRLEENGETVHQFKVPPRVRELAVRIDASVPSVSAGEDVDLSDAEAFNVNEVATTAGLILPHVTRGGQEYVLEVRGRNGEMRRGELVSVQLHHRDVKTPITFSLQSDEQGRILLGRLAEIATINVRMADGLQLNWTLDESTYSYLPVLTGVAGEPILVPWMRPSEEPIREELGLLELRDGKPVVDRFEQIQIHAGCLTLRDLAAGDYLLLLKRDGRRIHVDVSEGAVQDGQILGDLRYLERTNPRPMALLSPVVNEEKVRIPTRHAGPNTRIHVFASRYMAPFNAWSNLHVPARQAAAIATQPTADSLYVAGRDIGDEYRYILDRRSTQRYPGNMLARPGLLLNPWAVRETETGELRAMAGEEYGERDGGRARNGISKGESAAARAGLSDPQDLNFLARPAVVKANLRPDENGVVELERKDLGDRHMLWIVAVDGLHTAWRPLALQEAAPVLRDRRVIQPLDPAKHFVQRRNIDVLNKGGTVAFPDLTEAQIETYDSIGAVYRLFMTLNQEQGGDEKLGGFEFIVNWPSLTPEQKREKYAEFACHELHFFLYQKDRAFFDEVVRPYLANKKDKTFMDQYLLEGDLAPYAQRWAFGQLNAVERILLGRRLGQQAQMTRHIIDRFNLIPPNIEQDNRLFELALQGSALSTEGIAHELSGRVALELKQKAADGDPFGMRRSLVATVRDQLGAPAPAPAAPAADMPAEAPAMEREEMAEGKAREKAAKRQADASLSLEKAKFDRARVRRFYRDVAPTMEYAENNYYKLRITEQIADLVSVNGFWRDYARHEGNGPFLSTKVAEAHGNFTEMMLALAVLDLPFEGGEHQLGGPDPGAEAAEPVTLTAASPIIAFFRQVEAVEPDAEKVPVLVSQNFFQYGDRYREVENERVDKFVTDEFLIETVYGAQVVVTNPTSSRQRLDVLLQVPQGAMPVLSDKTLASRHISLEPFESLKVEYHFYFPEPGDYAHFPVHVARRENLVAFAEPVRLNVVKEPTEIDRECWDYISQHGTDEQVLSFLGENNVESTNLDRIAWRMRDAEMFKKVVALLNGRFAYNDTLWSYSIMHNEAPAIRQYLRYQDGFVEQCGSYLQSTLLAIDPVERRAWELLEYDPLVNARVHQLGPERKIANEAVYNQYMAMLDILAHKPQFDANDRMNVVYYLLLQDRVGEALDFFGKVDAEKLDSRLQYQ